MSLRKPLPKEGVVHATAAPFAPKVTAVGQAPVSIPLSTVLQVGMECHREKTAELIPVNQEVDEYRNNLDAKYKKNSPVNSLQKMPGNLWYDATTRLIPIQPATANPPKMLDRTEILRQIGYHADGVNTILYHQHFPDETVQVYSSDPSGLHLADDVVPIVRMWGFAACKSWEEAYADLYTKAVHELCEQSLKPWLDERGKKPSQDIILQYDGDACWEKKEEKFSHNIMVAQVAGLLRNEFKDRTVKVHLLITKIDKDSLAELVQKFGSIKEGTYVDGVLRHSMELRSQFPSTVTAPMHYYPNHTVATTERAGHFHSITLALQSKVGCGGPSEPSNIQLALDVLNHQHSASIPGTVSMMPWFVICVGGNTEKGIEAVHKSGIRFECAARTFLAAKTP